MKVLVGTCAGVATLALALGYAGQALWAGAGLCIAIGLVWLASQWRGAHWATDACLAGWVGLAAFGAWQGLAAGWMLLSVVAALASWDLDHFARSLRAAGHVAQRAELTRDRLRRLAIVAGMGLLLGGIALGVRFELTFGWALLVAALAIYSLSRLIGAGRATDE